MISKLKLIIRTGGLWLAQKKSYGNRKDKKGRRIQKNVGKTTSSILDLGKCEKDFPADKMMRKPQVIK